MSFTALNIFLYIFLFFTYGHVDQGIEPIASIPKYT
jgi:hypothetical protein